MIGVAFVVPETPAILPGPFVISEGESLMVVRDDRADVRSRLDRLLAASVTFRLHLALVLVGRVKAPVNVVLDPCWPQVDLDANLLIGEQGVHGLPDQVAALFYLACGPAAPGRDDQQGVAGERAGVREPLRDTVHGCAGRRGAGPPLSAVRPAGGAAVRPAAPVMGGIVTRRGHVYRRPTKSGGWSRWHAVVDVEPEEDGKRRQVTRRSTRPARRTVGWSDSSAPPRREGRRWPTT